MVRSLPEELRVPLILSYQQGFTHTEIGEIMDITPNAVKCRIHDAVTRLRSLVTEEHR